MASSLVPIKERYLIDADDPLHNLDTPSAKAFAARDKDEPGTPLFALICTPGLPTRMSVMRQLRGDLMTGILPLLEWDTVFWPPFNQETMIVIYRRPLGGSVTDAIDEGLFKVNEYELKDIFFAPLCRTLKILDAKNIVHREIRVSNLYFMDQEREEVVLGDCVTCPPGFDQPVVYEPLERSMASPGGRGTGTVADDLYALAVTLVGLILGRQKIEEIQFDELTYSKIEKGSYATIVGKERIMVTLMEPLRGMLIDELGERWEFPEIDLWLDGKRQTPMQRKFAKKVDNPFEFSNQEFRNTRSLAHAFSKDISEAAKAIREETLELWLRRSIGNGDLADTIRISSENAKSNSTNFRGSDSYLVSRVCIQLDPSAPIRFKEIAFLPDAFGPVLAIEMLREGKMDSARKALNYGLTDIWFKAESHSIRDPRSMEYEDAFGKLRALMQNNTAGYGIERCLYELNTSLPCLSPLIREHYVIEIIDLLPTLDAIADSVDNKLDPFDTHIVAFIASRFKEHIEPHLQALSESKRASQLVGMLSLLAYMQWKLKAEPLFALAGWVGGLLGPTIKSYYSRTTRSEIEKEMSQIVRNGSMPELFNLIDNADKRSIDANGYVGARNEFALAEQSILEIQQNELASKEITLKMGQKSAAMTSIILSILFVSTLFIIESF